MWRKVYKHPIFALVGVAAFIFGVPGMIDDWGGWQEWQQGAPWWFGFISGFGAAMVAFWAIHVCGPTVMTIYKWIIAFKKDPFRLLLVGRAHLSPGNGIQMAKLFRKARSVETAREIFDIFDGSPGKERVADAYASYAQALMRFDCVAEATGVLLTLDEQGIPDIDIADAKDRFFYPQDDEEVSVKDLADRTRKEAK